MKNETVKPTTRKILFGAVLFFYLLALLSVILKPSWFSIGTWFVGSVLVVTGLVIIAEAGYRVWKKASHPQSLTGNDWLTIGANVIAGVNLATGFMTIVLGYVQNSSFVFVMNQLQVISIPSLVAGVIISTAYLLTK
jgi:hypothetical protein